MKTQVIQLERHDDVTSINDKIAWSKASRVLLVWPKRGRVFNRLLDLLLVQRACLHVGAQLACVAEDDEILDHARELGVPVFRSVKYAERIPWRKQRRKKSFEPRSSILRPKLDEIRSTLHPVSPRWSNRIWVRIGALLATVAAVVLLLLAFLPQAQVTLPLAVSEQIVDLPVWASSDLSTVSLTGGLPARVVSAVVQGQASRPSSGSLAIPQRTASGEVQFTNLTSSMVVVPAGTVVQTTGDTPVQFQTIREVVMYGKPGESVDSPVKAVKAGSRGNAAAGTVKAVVGRLGALAAVSNRYSISGGSDVLGTTASQGDIEALESQLSANLKENARRQLQSQLAPGSRLLDVTLKQVKIVDEIIDPPMGLPSEQVILNVQIEYQAWTIREADLERVARTVLEAGRPAETTPLQASFHSSDLSRPEILEGQVAWKIRATEWVQANWDSEILLRAVAGRTIQEARSALASFPGLAGQPGLSITPDWWPVVPLLPARIQVEVR